jgi:hypothetical protein
MNTLIHGGRAKRQKRTSLDQAPEKYRRICLAPELALLAKHPAGHETDDQHMACRGVCFTDRVLRTCRK